MKTLFFLIGYALGSALEALAEGFDTGVDRRWADYRRRKQNP